MKNRPAWPTQFILKKTICHKIKLASLVGVSLVWDATRDGRGLGRARHRRQPRHRPPGQRQTTTHCKDQVWKCIFKKFIYFVMRLLASSWEILIGSVTFTTHMSDHWSVGCYVVSKFPKRAENFTSMFLSENLFLNACNYMYIMAFCFWLWDLHGK